MLSGLAFVRGNPLGLLGCASDSVVKNHSEEGGEKMELPGAIRTIHLAGGCFWGTEHFLRQVRGVVKTQVGYANGTVENPTYEQVCMGNTGAAECVKVQYDPEVLSLGRLLWLFFQSIDPTSRNRQGADVGTQYRTGVYYSNAEDRAVVEAELVRLQSKYPREVVVEYGPLRNFYPAEDYHQGYLVSNPRGYCHISSALFSLAREANREVERGAFRRKSDAELQRVLTPLQYDVTQREATEPPFSHPLNREHRPGIYVDITTGEPLFSSRDRFDAGCGWPSFSRPIQEEVIGERTDNSYGMMRTEVRSSLGNAHLGHLFDDGPMELGGLRYCINGAALRFIPLDSMAREGYADYIPFVED